MFAAAAIVSPLAHAASAPAASGGHAIAAVGFGGDPGDFSDPDAFITKGH